MKPKRYAVILGLVVLGGWCLWRAQESAPESVVPEASREAHRATKLLARPPIAVPPAKDDPVARERLWDRLGADLTIALAEVDSVRRDDKLKVFMDSIGFAEIPATLEFLQRQEQTEVLQDVQVLLIRKGAAVDSKTAAGWAMQMPAGATRSAALAGVGVVWANQDLSEAARWASELAEGEDRENGLGHVAFEAARTKPLLALELSADLAPNDARDELVRHAARQWATQEPAEAAAWAGELTDATLREQVLADIAAAWGETDPNSAAKLALQSLSGGKPQEDALMGIAQHWVQKEPDRAAAWVLEFPETLQQTALENVVKLWANQDARAAEKWIESLPSGSQRDVALNAFAGKVGAAEN